MTPAWVLREMTAGWAHENRARDFRARVTDCWGFCMYLSATHLGRTLPDLLDHYLAVDVEQVGNAVAVGRQDFAAVELKDACLGDIVLVKLPMVPFHAGIYTGSGHMLHLGRSRGADHPSIRPGTPMGRRVEGAYRYVG